ncbi:MAG: hypothetical protein LBT46_01440 [Planctomycetaceae bacterium]|jgi:TIGR03009 family protein|nr:hypothetical protein [Planctomycetaceae bacterium]
MPLVFRSAFVFGLAVLYCHSAVGQTPSQMPTSQQQAIQRGTMQNAPIQQQPIKVPPLAVVENGRVVYQRNPAADANPIPAAGVSPVNYPQGIKTAMTQSGTVPLYSGQPQAVTVPQEQRVHAGHSEPPQKIVPFFLNLQEQRELDDFLVRWEKYSRDVKRYDVDFYMSTYNFAIPGADPNKPYKITFGYFKYIANPLRFVYHVEGEWKNGGKEKRDGDKNPQIFAEKIIIDEKTVFKYDYNAKTVMQVNVPPEMIGKGIADSPLPLIFGAKADDLKRRFSMKIAPTANPDRIWLQAKPLLLEDQQEFSMIEIILDRKTLQAVGLKKYDISAEAYTVYELRSPKVNDRLSSVLDDLKTWFSPTVEKGWKHEVNDWIAVQPHTALPAQQQTVPQQSQRNDIPLYRVQ